MYESFCGVFEGVIICSVEVGGYFILFFVVEEMCLVFELVGVIFFVFVGEEFSFDYGD